MLPRAGAHRSNRIPSLPAGRACAILASAVRQGQRIAIFEPASRTPCTFGMSLGVPLAVWLLTVRPFR